MIVHQNIMNNCTSLGQSSILIQFIKYLISTSILIAWCVTFLRKRQIYRVNVWISMNIWVEMIEMTRSSSPFENLRIKTILRHSRKSIFVWPVSRLGFLRIVLAEEQNVRFEFDWFWHNTWKLYSKYFRDSYTHTISYSYFGTMFVCSINALCELNEIYFCE